MPREPAAARISIFPRADGEEDEVRGLVRWPGRALPVCVSTDRRAAARYDVQVSPTLVLVLNGRVVGRASGVHPGKSATFRSLLDSLPAGR